MGALQHLQVFKIDTYITDRPSRLILGALIRVLSQSNIFIKGHNTFIPYELSCCNNHMAKFQRK